MSDQLSPVEKVLERLEDYKERKNEFRARCPAHQGNSKDSLSIKEGDDGRALLVCHADCDRRDIVNALGLEMVDLFAHNNGRPSRGVAKKAARKTGGEGKILTTDELPGTVYGFESPAGELLYAQAHKGPYYLKVGEDLWETRPGILDNMAKVLYNLPELVEGVRAGKTIYHLEGPKDV